MEKKDCNSKLCKNEQLKDMNAYVWYSFPSITVTLQILSSINSTIGSKVQIGDHEYSHSEALRILVQRTEM